VWVQVHFCTCDPNPTRTEQGLDADFIFHPWVYQKPKKNSKLKRNLKNPKETQKPPKETHLQNPTGTRTRPKTRRVRVPNFTPGFGFDVKFNPTTFFTGRIFDQPDLNLTSCHP
jgi:hypothetical protein